MRPVSPAFQAAVTSSHAIVSRVRVLEVPGTMSANPAGRDLNIIDGTVTLDGTAGVRGSIDVLVEEPWPDTATVQDLVPYGTEVAVSRGVIFGNGVIERCPLGIFRLTISEQQDAPKGTIRLTGQDRMQAIIDGDLESPTTYAATALVGAVVEALVQEVLPGQLIEWDDATVTAQLGVKTIVQEDRFAFLDDLVRSFGKIWYFDHRGILIVKTPPDPAVPVLTVASGPETGVLTAISRILTRENVYNAVVATGESLDSIAAKRAVARDTNPASVTFWGGPFGKVPLQYSSPKIRTDAQALAAANAELSKVTGLPYTIDFQMVPNPALEPFDVVSVVYPLNLENTPHVRTETHVLDQLVIGLGADQGMSAACRLTTNPAVA